jgi:hypothetical protein
MGVIPMPIPIVWEGPLSFVEQCVMCALLNLDDQESSLSLITEYIGNDLEIEVTLADVRRTMWRLRDDRLVTSIHLFDVEVVLYQTTLRGSELRDQTWLNVALSLNIACEEY